MENQSVSKSGDIQNEAQFQNQQITLNPKRDRFRNTETIYIFCFNPILILRCLRLSSRTSEHDSGHHMS